LTVMWNERGEQVSMLKLEDGRMWVLIEKDLTIKEMHVFKTKRVLFTKLAQIIRLGNTVVAHELRSEEKRFVLEQVPWEEIAIEVIRKRL